MSETTQAKGAYRFDKDTRRYHRFKVKIDGGGLGTLYLPKGLKPLPKQLTLTYQEKNK